MDNSRTLKHDGKEKVVNSRFSLAHHQAKPRRKHKDDGFLLYNHSHNKYKGPSKDCQLGNPCELPSFWELMASQASSDEIICYNETVSHLNKRWCQNITVEKNPKHRWRADGVTGIT
ncbi:hypothetical protein Tco_0667235 [Tanacetum coccineum]